MARELRQLGDALYWRHKLLELLIRNYKAAHGIKWGASRSCREGELFVLMSHAVESDRVVMIGAPRRGLDIGCKMVDLKGDVKCCGAPSPSCQLDRWLGWMDWKTDGRTVSRWMWKTSLFEPMTTGGMYGVRVETERLTAVFNTAVVPPTGEGFEAVLTKNRNQTIKLIIVDYADNPEATGRGESLV